MYKVIVIEDEDIIRAGLMYEIDWHRLDCVVVSEARNGLEGLIEIEKYDPDIVLLDINMPVKDGIDVLKETYEKYNFVTVILSGYSSFEYAQKAIEYDVIGYLTKPVDSDELEEVIEKAKSVIDNRRILDKSQSYRNDLKRISIINPVMKTKEKNQIVEDMLDFVANNFDKKVNMKLLASELHYSETYLNRNFKREMGITFNNYLNKYRIQKALDFLRENSNISIVELSSKCGFNDYKYFNVVFRKFIGLSIKDYITLTTNE